MIKRSVPLNKGTNPAVVVSCLGGLDGSSAGTSTGLIPIEPVISFREAVESGPIPGFGPACGTLRFSSGFRVGASAALEDVPPVTPYSGSCPRRTVVSSLPETARRPSGEKATELTPMVCPSIRHYFLAARKVPEMDGPIETAG